MKHDMNDLRSALPGEPESCRTALLQAARSVKEEEPMKTYTFRTVLAAAAIIAAMMAAAVAAANSGLLDWFQSAYNATLPKAAQEVLSASEKMTLETGKVTFTVNELLCDGKIAYLTAEAQIKEKGSAVAYPDSGDPTDRIGEQLARELNHPDVTGQTSFADAARATGLPLYCVSTRLNVEDETQIDSMMMDGSPMENGSTMLVRMLYFRKALNMDTLPVTIVARVNEVDLNTMEFVEGGEQCAAAEAELPIHGVVARRSYTPEGDAKLAECFTLTGAEAEQTCAGVYVTVHIQLDVPMTVQETLETGIFFDVLDAQGRVFPTGLSLTGEYLDAAGRQLEWISEEKLEGIQYQMMISVDELPDAFIVTDGETEILVTHS